jgi:hypothetical protein
MFLLPREASGLSHESRARKLRRPPLLKLKPRKNNSSKSCRSDSYGQLTDLELSLQEYIEAHKSSKLLFCWYTHGLGVVFSPSDHHGIWGMQREGISGKGILPEYALEVLERIAKEKGLA